MSRFANQALVSLANDDKHAKGLKALADSFRADHTVSHKRESIEEAISAYEQVLQLRPLGHELRAEAVSDLGEALHAFCSYNGTDDNRAHRCIQLLREAVQLRPPDHPLRDRSLHNLAKTLFFVGYDQEYCGLHALEESISLNHATLELRIPGHPERAETLGNLAGALTLLFEQCGDPAMITESIRMNREVLQLRLPGHPRRSLSLNNLALALELASVQGNTEALTDAISLHRQSLELCPPGHPLRFTSLSNLANALYKRFTRQLLPAALSEAIALQREACETIHDGHPRWATSLNNLANSLIASFRRGHDLSTIAEAISLLRKARLLQPRSEFILDSLAEALLAHFIVYNETEHLLESLSLHREVLALRPPGHIWQPKSLQRLGCLLCKPGCRSWFEARELFHEAMESCPVGHPSRASLCSDMSRCFLEPGSPFFDLAEGILHLSEALSDDLSHVNQRLELSVADLQHVEVAYVESMRDADASTRDRHSRQILKLYTQVISLLPRAANFGLDPKTRLRVITGSDEIARNAAARALLLGQIPQAVELLEEGRGTFWTQTLNLRATAFDGIPDSDHNDLLRLLRMLEHGAREGEDSGRTIAERERTLEKRRQLNEEAQTLISNIRTRPGHVRFLMPAAFDSLLNGLPDGIIVILNASRLSHHALLLQKTSELATSIELTPCSSGFDWTTLRAQLPRDMDAQLAQQDELHLRAMRLDTGQVDAFENLLFQLWTSMVQPVLRKLGLQKAVGRDRPRLWWCVTGELGFLPIHAAGRYRGNKSICISDYAVSSYTPTLSALTKARRDCEPIPHSSLSGLLICETYADHGAVRHLPGAEREVCLVRECFESARARVYNAHSPHTSLGELRTLLSETPAHILHLACHGVQDVDPLSSALILHDGKLTIGDMMQLDLPRAVLAFLSACQTAKGDRNAPDQAVHLAASMLFCGFRSVIGTMWLMHDEDGPKLARLFYECLFAKETFELDDIAYALDEAVQGLRGQGVLAQRWALFMHMGG